MKKALLIITLALVYFSGSTQNNLRFMEYLSQKKATQTLHYGENFTPISVLKNTSNKALLDKPDSIYVYRTIEGEPETLDRIFYFEYTGNRLSSKETSGEFNNQRELYIYNDVGDITEYTLQFYNEIESEWVGFNRQTYTYNEMGYISSEVLENYDFFSNNWEVNSTQNYNYEIENNLVTAVEILGDNTGIRYEFDYNETGVNPIEIREYSETDNAWSLEQKQTNLIWVNQFFDIVSFVYPLYFVEPTENGIVKSLLQLEDFNNIADEGNFEYYSNNILESTEAFVSVYENNVRTTINVYEDEAVEENLFLYLTFGYDNCFGLNSTNIFELTETGFELLNSFDYTIVSAEIGENCTVTEVSYSTTELIFIPDEPNPIEFTYEERLEIYQSETIVSVNEITDISKSYSLFPNPAENNVTIQFNSQANDNYEITLFDITGKVLINKLLGSINRGIEVIEDIDISSLEKGIYFVMLSTKHQKSTKKLIVQ